MSDSRKNPVPNSGGKWSNEPEESHVYGPPGTGDWRRILRIVTMVAIGLFVAIFALRNSNSVEVDFVVAKVTVPLLFVIIGMFLLGWVWGLLFGWMRRRAHRKAAKQK